MFERSILCESPRTIVNPLLSELLCTYKCYQFKGRMYNLTPLQYNLLNYSCDNLRSFLKRLHVDLSFCNVVDTESGELFPFLIQVPCGKCTVCKHKKANDWAARAVCETQESSNVPFFVTLTYNDASLPENGVNKRDVQNWFKRLRITLDRGGFSNRIRYFLCAEYGRRTHRPHYHAILWNFPNVSSKLCDVLSYIESTWHQGFCYVRPCNQNAINYTMKYIRKDCVVPYGMNDVFFLSSRRAGGIGAPWIDRVKQFYYDTPEIHDIELVDKFSGEYVKCPFPKYFRDRLFPPRSRVLSHDLIDCFKLFDYLRGFINSKLVRNDEDFSYYNSLSTNESIIYAKFCCLPRFLDCVQGSNIFSSRFKHFTPDMSTVFHMYSSLMMILLEAPFDVTSYVNKRELKKYHLAGLSNEISSKPEINIKDYAYKIREDLKRRSYNDIL